MERLTNKREADAQREEYERRLANGYPRNIPEERFLRLASYEDTGLSPQACAQAREAGKVLSSCDISFRRLAELLTADRDGRLVVLPCKLGTKVYRIRYEIADYPDDPDLEIADTWFTPEYRDDIGKTVFLTREEAERAMQEMEGKKDG